MVDKVSGVGRPGLGKSTRSSNKGGALKVSTEGEHREALKSALKASISTGQGTGRAIELLVIKSVEELFAGSDMSSGQKQRLIGATLKKISSDEQLESKIHRVLKSIVF